MSSIARIEKVYPLSPLQEGLTFHTLMEPDAGVYITQAAYRVEGDVERAGFARAWRHVARRHAVLRTAFVWKGHRLMQAIFDDVEIPCVEEAFDSAGGGVAGDRLAEWLQADRRRDFVLTHPPLFRIALLRTGPRTSIVVCTHHHAMLDGWSGMMLLREALAAYDEQRRGSAIDLPRAPDYSTYVDWLARQDRDRADQYWRKALDGLSGPTALPRPLTPIASGEHRRGREVVHLPLRPLQDVAAREGLTVGTIVQALWAVLLARHSGERHVVMGSTMSMRSPDLPGSSALAGLLINTVPLRVGVTATAATSAWMRDLQVQWAEAREQGYLSLTRLRTLTGLPPRAPLFETLFTFENYPAETTNGHPGRPADPSAPRVVDVHVEEQDIFPLELIAVPHATGELQLQLQYASPPYARADAQALLAQFACLLHGFMQDPATPVGALPLIDDAARRDLIAAGAGPAPQTTPVGVIAGFTAQADAGPDRIAVEFGDEAIAYDALRARAAAWTAWLRAHGVKPEVRVAVILDRSPDLVAILLGIWGAGGVYVPIDRDYPAARIADLVRDSAASVVIVRAADVAAEADAKAKAEVADGAADEATVETPRDGVTWLRVEDLPATSTQPLQPPAAAPHAPAPAALAYIVYTSGSTGQPKGALLEHRGLVNHLAAKIEELRLDADDVVALSASPSFDISIWQMVAPLLSGGRVRILGDAARDDVATLDECTRGAISVIETVPAFLGALIATAQASADASPCASLRWMICNGDALPPAMVDAWQRLYPHARLMNAYGATECSDDVSHWVAGASPITSACAPLGSPLRHTQWCVLDDHGALVPVGVPGELHIGGIGLGRGYWRRPDLTAARWVPDAISGEAGARLYRTGDLVRWGPDRSIEFLGRLDRQVKVRGFRIELAEVEAHVHACPGVRTAVALVRGTMAQARLVAFVEVSDPAVDEGRIREFLQARVPEHMVPARIVILDRLPVTSNGKVDRAALPVDDAPAEMPQVEDVPLTPAAELLAGIWQAVLACENVGRADSFFDLGGDSILATQAAARIRRVFAVDFPLRTLFEHPTLAACAEAIEALRGRDAGTPPPIARRAADVPVTLSFGQQRLWFLQQLEPESAAYNIALGWELIGPIDEAALQSAFKAIVLRHDALRTTYRSAEGMPAASVVAHPAVRLRMADVSALPSGVRERVARRVALREARGPFDLSAAPLVRLTLVRLDATRHWLRLTLHHIAGDGWSTGVIARELGEAYNAHRRGAPSPLAALPFQYADFAAWQRQWLTSGAEETHTRYWRDALRGLEPLQLPTDFARPTVANFQAVERRFRIDPALTRELRALGRGEGATLFMVLMAAAQVLLSRYTDQSDFAVGVPIANRTREDVEDLVGFFINTLVVRTRRLTPTASVRQLLAAVREQTLAAYEHQDLPFDRLVEELNPRRDMGRAPLVQVLLAIQNMPRGDLALDDVATGPVRTPPAGTHTDLTFLFIEDPDGGLDGAVHYATELFTAARIDRLIGHLQTLLTSMTRDRDAALEELEWLTPAERRQLLDGWADGGDLPVSATVVAQIGAQAAARPDAIALCAGAEQVSYGMLHARTGAWARALRACGVGPEARVGVCLDRGVSLVMASLAVWKAGAAYVPLDPAYPASRLALMVADSAAALVVTTAAIATRVADPSWIWIDVATLPADTVATSAPPVHPAQLAQVIYTSGSTGVPKGVGVAHGGLRAILGAASERLGHAVRPGTRLLQFASWSFDAASWEMGTALTRGACLVLARPDERLPGGGLEESLATQQIDVALLLPSLLAIVDPARAPHLTTLIAGGEACPPEVLERWGTGRHFANAYGPTEGTIIAAMSGAQHGRHTPPLGRPLAGVTTYVLGPAMQPVPIGVPGELFIGGAGVARGYVNQPSSTAARFVPDPFSDTAGARLYRTGDRVCWREDAQLEFLGRVDRQVKVRGHRIELDEVAHALEREPGVRQAVAVLREIGDGDEQLVGYVVGDAQSRLDGQGLRTRLRERIPAFMVPAAIVVLDRWPLTPNDKIDLRALPAPVITQGAGREPPRTSTEQRLARIWQDLLRCGPVSRDDDFFMLGGHSLLATQVVSRIRTEWRFEFPLRALFEAPTVGGLAARVDALRDRAAGPIVTIEASREQLLDNLAHLPDEDIDLLIKTLSNA